MTLTPVAGATGTVAITVFVSDDGGLTTNTTFQLSVQASPPAPALYLATEGSGTNSSGLDAQALTPGQVYTITAVPQEGWALMKSFMWKRRSFPGGQKQRIAIARALVNDPDIIFADEPTGNLDSVSGAQVMSILDGLNHAGRTVILVTHETNTAKFADRIIRLRDGVIESDQPVKNPRHSKDEFFK